MKKRGSPGKKSRSTKKVSLALSPEARRRLNEVILILIAGLAIYLLLALLTYHSTDPSWSDTGNGVVFNAGGRVGAFLSDIFLYAFGYPAYIFPLLLLLLMGVIFREQRILKEMNRVTISLRVVGFLLVISTLCGFSEMLLPNVHFHLPMDAGGLLGYLLNDHLLGTFNNYGSALIFSAFLLIGIVLFTGLSCITGAQWVIKQYWKGVVYLAKLFSQYVKEEWAKRGERAKQKKVPEPIVIAPKVIKPPIIKEPVSPPVVIIKKPVAPVQTNSSATKISLNTNQLPPLSLLDQPQEQKQKTNYSKEKLTSLSQELEEHLSHFGIDARVVGVEPGPVITRFEVDLAPGMKVSRVTNIDKDLARSLSVASVRVVEVIPGKSVIGLEIPNQNRMFICLSEILNSEAYQQSISPMTLALGKDISGHVTVTDLGKMPHLLVAGTTGSGKSVAINAMLLSMLFKSTPQQLRLILIDPKMLELSIYKDIPHLLTPVVTDMKEAANALRWSVIEMDRRYKLMSYFGVRNLASFNAKIAEATQKGETVNNPLISEEAPPEVLEQLPYIVVVIDELADMMMVAGKKVEELIARIAQKARAAGIHLILATQRPSVDVITGLIKANIPSRVAFNVSSRIDSRTILDQQGAQQLLGNGDMLYLPVGTSIPTRLHGPFVSDDEIHRVVDALKSMGRPDYIESILKEEGSDSSEGGSSEGGSGGGEGDPLYDQAVVIVTETRRASISLVQRRLRIGYNRAANLLEAMEAAGVVSSVQSNGSREVLAPEPMKD